MPNIKSAKKRVLVAEVRRQRNAANKSTMKTAIKKYETALANKSENTYELLQAAVSELGKNAQRGVIHKNTAARQISRLTRHYNEMMA